VWLKQHNSFLLSLQFLLKSGSHYDWPPPPLIKNFPHTQEKLPTPHHLWISQCLLSNPSPANTHMD
jgi:hypothetical protein